MLRLYLYDTSSCGVEMTHICLCERRLRLALEVLSFTVSLACTATHSGVPVQTGRVALPPVGKRCGQPRNSQTFQPGVCR